MERTSAFIRRLDAFCAQLNDGLIAFAALLAIAVTIATYEQRLPEIAALFQPIDPETGISMLSY